MTAKGETLRLCPYYDPVMRTLRFQYPNGLDSTEEKSLAELIARRGCQPLLRLAQAENLIDKVPATGLTSMDFDAVVQSGYYARAGLSIRPNLRNFQGSVRFKGEGTTTQMSWTPLSDDDRKYIDFFLYITPEDDRLRIWDMEAGRDLAVSVNMGALAKRGGGSSIGDNDRQTGTAAVVTTKRGRLALDSFHANEVKGRWPKIYKKIQNLGYWRDAESQGKATA
ncbi:hypothetical protein FRB97_008005 [Tulasnella sp. 331]|nr:hypothetical protein FRB97_008005 [Tulasnella sp. 331]KAG8878534.1 hypothetical protein FRB98_006099 [Tulasnella sp. 332]